MVFLGKVKNPVSDAMDRNLDAARALIDILAELQEKTEGRLDPEDQRLLQHTLTELRMNWLDESGKDAAAKGGEALPTAESPSAAETPPAASE